MISPQCWYNPGLSQSWSGTQTKQSTRCPEKAGKIDAWILLGADGCPPVAFASFTYNANLVHFQRQILLGTVAPSAQLLPRYKREFLVQRLRELQIHESRQSRHNTGE